MKKPFNKVAVGTFIAFEDVPAIYEKTEKTFARDHYNISCESNIIIHEAYGKRENPPTPAFIKHDSKTPVRVLQKPAYLS